MRILFLSFGVVLCAFAATAAAASADPGHRTIKLGYFSQVERPDRATIGAHIRASEVSRVPRTNVGTAWHGSATRQGAQSLPRAGDSSTTSLPNPFPPLAASASILKAAHPAGPGSFWYPDGGGHVCMYAPGSVLPCFTVVTAGGAAGAATVSPAGIAASVARRLPLLPGQINASPTRAGLTGAASWFWLDPAPQRRELSISLAGEAVTVIADPTVQWRFGDGATLDGGPGVPYQPGAAPAGAVTHVYQTRCLPGDQGHDPYVLASCGQNGYQLEAAVVWRISYQAAGPIAASGTLPTRTTTSDVMYPVGEARAFLAPAGGGT